MKVNITKNDLHVIDTFSNKCFVSNKRTLKDVLKILNYILPSLITAPSLIDSPHHVQ